MEQNECLSCIHAEKCVYAKYADAVFACILYTPQEDADKTNVTAAGK
jgi:hypothetical protein